MDVRDEKEKPFWVIFYPLKLFMSGHDTEEEAHKEEHRLNEEARKEGRQGHCVVIQRPPRQAE